MGLADNRFDPWVDALRPRTSYMGKIEMDFYRHKFNEIN
jgi:hypothetical protein